MNRFEMFFREVYGDDYIARLSPPLSFVEVLRDLPVFMRAADETETSEWLSETERRRLWRLEHNRTHGRHRNPVTLREKAKRKRILKRLKDKQIFAVVTEKGFPNLTPDERADFATARRRLAAKSRRRRARAEAQAVPSEA